MREKSARFPARRLGSVAPLLLSRKVSEIIVARLLDLRSLPTVRSLSSLHGGAAAATMASLTSYASAVRVARRSVRCSAERELPAPSPPHVGRRAAVLGAATLGVWRADSAVAYGLSVTPPPSNNSKAALLRRDHEAREEAERRREEMEAEANPGVLVTLPSGIQYRELDEGKPDGKIAQKGDTLFALYTVYRLAPGAYFKYSSGGTPIFLWSRGYGNEGQDDVGSTYKFVLGEPNSLPRAVAPPVLGMREGGRRRVLVPPQLGWVDGTVNPRPPRSAGRLENHREEPLLMEVDLVRVRKSRRAARRRRIFATSWPAPGTSRSNSRRRRRRSRGYSWETDVASVVGAGRWRVFSFDRQQAVAPGALASSNKDAPPPVVSRAEKSALTGSPRAHVLDGDLENSQHAPDELRHLAAFELDRLAEVSGQIPVRGAELDGLEGHFIGSAPAPLMTSLSRPPPLAPPRRRRRQTALDRRRRAGRRSRWRRG